MQRLPNWVVAYHGCDSAVGEEVLSSNSKHLVFSENEYDWLGNGIYFWENDPLRAMQWAEESRAKPRQTRGKVTVPFVVGAIIDLGLCLNLFDQPALIELSTAHAKLKATAEDFGLDLPINKGPDGMLRALDQAVITHAHSLRSKMRGVPPYQTVRSPFMEGGELYAGAGFHAKTHIQIAVRDTSCIKGYFRPRQPKVLKPRVPPHLKKKAA